MKLEVLPSGSLYTEDDEKNLKYLIDAFGSVVSLEDISSAYCQAERDFDFTCEILCSKQDNAAGSSALLSPDDAESRAEGSCEYPSGVLQENMSKVKPKRVATSMGTVSSVIGRDYFHTRPQPNEYQECFKPVKLHPGDFPASEIWNKKEFLPSTSSSETTNLDVEDFIYEMLKNGFELERSVIKNVIGQCGYDVQKSIDKLLYMSAATLEKSGDVHSKSSKHMEETVLDSKFISCTRNSLSKTRISKSNGRDEAVLLSRQTRKNDTEKEILESLFTSPGTIKEYQETTEPVRRENRQSPYGRPVSKPMEDITIEDFTFVTSQQINKSGSGEEHEDDYEEMRRSVADYRMTMKEYSKAAVNAYIEADYARAEKFREECQFYMKKAREADEKSVQKLVQSSCEIEEFSLNLQYMDPKEAISNLKLQLSSLSGIPSIPILKIVVGTNGEDKKDVRRKHLITKLLKKDEITWSEEGNGWIFSIRIDEIDPKKLSFANK